MRTVRPVHGRAAAVVSIQRFREHAGATYEFCLQPSDGDVKFFPAKVMDVKLIEGNITIVDTRQIR